MADYNGYANWETWNVSLWLSNEEPLYRQIVAFMRGYAGSAPYRDFIAKAGLADEKTPDGAAYLDPALDYDELDELFREIEGAEAA